MSRFLLRSSEGPRSMDLKADRHQWILGRLEAEGSVRVSDLANGSGHSIATLRRDLTELAESGALQRVYGGATRLPSKPSESQSLDVGESQEGLIGIIVPSSDYYYNSVIKGAMATVRRAGMGGMLAVTGYSQGEELVQFERLRRLGISGLVLTPSVDITEDSELLTEVTKADFPVVIAERLIARAADRARLDSVTNDHELGARLAVRHLYERGRRNILLAPIPTVTHERLVRGYLNELAELSLQPPTTDFEASQADREQWGRSPQHRLTKELFSSIIRSDVDALIINPDLHASQLLNIALSEGVRVPQDLDVVTYDDEIADMLEPPLTAVAPAKTELGSTAAELCLERVRADKAGEAFRRHITLVPKLHVRTLPAQDA